MFFASKVVFPRKEWGHRILHIETAFTIQRRLQAVGRTLVVLPVSVR